MTPEKIKQMVNAAIGEFIGTYTINGITVPSIWVGIPPLEARVKGLEVLISEVPERANMGNQIVSETWRITTVDHESVSGKITKVADRLRRKFRGAEIVFLQRPRTIEIKELKILPQITILWSTKELSRT